MEVLILLVAIKPIRNLPKPRKRTNRRGSTINTFVDDLDQLVNGMPIGGHSLDGPLFVMGVIESEKSGLYIRQDWSNQSATLGEIMGIAHRTLQMLRHVSPSPNTKSEPAAKSVASQFTPMGSVVSSSSSSSSTSSSSSSARAIRSRFFFFCFK